MTTIDDGSLKTNYLLKVLDLALEVGIIVGPLVDMGMDHLITLGELAVVFHNSFFYPVGNHQGLKTVPFIVGLNLNNL